MWQCIGHDHIVAALSGELRGGRPAHAYLFAGLPQVGKGTLALELAQALNCEDGAAGAPCGECRQCERIAAGLHADVERLTPRSFCEVSDHDHTREGAAALRICQVRRVEHLFSQSPYEGRTRVVIVDPAEALTNEAANAFLKTLEEPPPHCVLVLVAADPESLPLTVRSRCRTFTLRAVGVDALSAAMVERWGASSEEAEQLARMSQGRPGWARAAMLDESLLHDRLGLVDHLHGIGSATRDERLAYAETLARQWPAQRDEIRLELEAWQAWWRDVLLVRSGRDDLIIHRERAEVLSVAAAKYATLAIVEFIEAVRRAMQQLEENGNPRLVLDVLMLAMPHPSARPLEAITP